MPELAILTPSNHVQATPPSSRLENVVLHLEAIGDLRNLICFVEAWSAASVPTPRALLAQARAFHRLRCVDRAWLRVKELVEVGEGQFEVNKCAARLCIDRGWSTKARSFLDAARAMRPRDPELEQWTSEVALVSGLDDLDDDPSAAFDVQLWLAEQFLNANLTHKARVILERLQRKDAGHARVADLLWALDADYQVEGTLGELCEKLGPDLSHLADLPEDPDHTESARLDELAEEPSDGVSFPNLFRNMDGLTSDYDDGLIREVTETREMASPGELKSMEAQGIPSDLTPASLDGDTQILHVVHRERMAAGESVHTATPDIDSAFDLGQFRREMGMRLNSDLVDAFESEDEDVILLTHQERDDPLPREATENLDPIELDPTDDVPVPSEADTVIVPPQADAESAEQAGSPPTPVREEAPPPPEDRKTIPTDTARNASAWWGLMLFGVLLATVGALLLAVGFFAIT